MVIFIALNFSLEILSAKEMASHEEKLGPCFILLKNKIIPKHSNNL